MTVQRLLLPLVSVIIIWAALAAGSPTAPEARWWRGNTHTHPLWSAGDAAPEVPTAWYKANGYHFLVLSDHNILQVGERWFPVSEDGSARLKAAELEALQTRFAGQVEVRDGEKGREMRLHTLPELKARFDEGGQFLLVPGEEVTAHWKGADQNHPVHINAIGLRGRIPPRGGDSVVDLMNSALEAIEAHGVEHGVPVLAHLNHPNFGWGVTWEDLAQMRAERFFEVYNGHRGVRSHGDDAHLDTEAMWDMANARRLSELDLPLLYGVATDDSHSYYGGRTSVTGRGWVQVWAPDLSEAALIIAMKAGDFYASSGVTLAAVSRTQERYRVEIDEEDGVGYTTQFVGVRAGQDSATVLASTAENPAVYEYGGDELFVRAVVTSTQLHPDPYREGDLQQAWTQPLDVSR